MRTVHVAQYNNGKFKKRAAVESQGKALALLAKHLENKPDKEEYFENNCVIRMIFTWPYYYTRRGMEELKTQMMLHNPPEWAEKIFTQVMNEIDSGELQNTWTPAPEY